MHGLCLTGEPLENLARTTPTQMLMLQCVLKTSLQQSSAGLMCSHKVVTLRCVFEGHVTACVLFVTGEPQGNLVCKAPIYYQIEVRTLYGRRQFRENIGRFPFSFH